MNDTPTDNARATFRAKQQAAEAAGLYKDIPELPAYRHPDGVHLFAWCPHEGRWHFHGICRQMEGCRNREHNGPYPPGCTCPKGSGDGHRGAHCTCPLSPLSSTGYYLREVADYGPGVPNWVDPDASYSWVSETAAGYECDGCRHFGLCACDQPQCPEDSACAEHAYTDCVTCWKVHGGGDNGKSAGRPGYGHCKKHGILRVHFHQTGYCTAVDNEGLNPRCFTDAEIQYVLPEDGSENEVHPHCPSCWAEYTLRSRNPRTGGLYAIPACPGCRELVTKDQLARIVAALTAEARWFDPPKTQSGMATVA